MVEFDRDPITFAWRTVVAKLRWPELFAASRDMPLTGVVSMLQSILATHGEVRVDWETGDNNNQLEQLIFWREPTELEAAQATAQDKKKTRERLERQIHLHQSAAVYLEEQLAKIGK